MAGQVWALEFCGSNLVLSNTGVLGMVPQVRCLWSGNLTLYLLLPLVFAAASCEGKSGKSGGERMLERITKC